MWHQDEPLRILLEKTQYQVHQCTIVRLETRAPLSERFLLAILEKHGTELTQIAQFIWVRFDLPSRAMDFYLQYHKSEAEGQQVIATPIQGDQRMYNELIAQCERVGVPRNARKEVSDVYQGFPSILTTKTTWH